LSRFLLLFFSRSQLSGLARFPILLILACSPVFVYRCVCSAWLNSQLVLKQNAGTDFCSCLVRSGPYFSLTTGLRPKATSERALRFSICRHFVSRCQRTGSSSCSVSPPSKAIIFSCARSGPQLVTSCSVLVSLAQLGAPAATVRELLLSPLVRFESF
jgi:hypothetical protein